MQRTTHKLSQENNLKSNFCYTKKYKSQENFIKLEKKEMNAQLFLVSIRLSSRLQLTSLVLE